MQARAAFSWNGTVGREVWQGLPSASAPASPSSYSTELARPRCPDTRRAAAVTSPAHTRCRTMDDTLSVSNRPTGVYQIENLPKILQMDLCGQISECTRSPDGTSIPESGCKTEPQGNQQLFLWIFFFFMQLFHLFSSYGRTDAISDFCLVWLQ